MPPVPICLVCRHKLRLAGRDVEQMRTDRHGTRYGARLKDMVLQEGLDEVACFLERADPPSSPNARPVLAAITGHLRVGGAWRALPTGFPAWRTVYGWRRGRPPKKG